MEYNIVLGNILQLLHTFSNLSIFEDICQYTCNIPTFYSYASPNVWWGGTEGYFNISMHLGAAQF